MLLRAPMAPCSNMPDPFRYIVPSFQTCMLAKMLYLTEVTESRKSLSLYLPKQWPASLSHRDQDFAYA